jgi:hypothetical protein
LLIVSQVHDVNLAYSTGAPREPLPANVVARLPTAAELDDYAMKQWEVGSDMKTKLTDFAKVQPRNSATLINSCIHVFLISIEYK